MQTINMFLGYFVHITRRERDGIVAKDLQQCKVIFGGVAVVDPKALSPVVRKQINLIQD